MMTENNINDFENMEEYSNIPKEVIPLLYEWESMPYSSWKNHIVNISVLVAKLIPDGTTRCGIHRIPFQEKELHIKGHNYRFLGKYCPECVELYIDEEKMEWLSEALDERGIQSWIQPAELTMAEWEEETLPVEIEQKKIIYTSRGLKGNPICPADHKTVLIKETYIKKYNNKEHTFEAMYCPKCKKVFMGPRAAEDLNLDLGDAGIPACKVKLFEENKPKKIYPPDYLVNNGRKIQYKIKMGANWDPLNQKNIVIVGDSKYCAISDHYTEEVYGLIEVLNRQGERMRYLADMGYCEDCKKYFIDSMNFDILMANGRPVLTILNESEEKYPFISGEQFEKEEQHLQQLENTLEGEIKRIRAIPWYVEQYTTDNEYYGSNLKYDKHRSKPLTEEINHIGQLEIKPYGYRTDIKSDDDSAVYYLGAEDIVINGKQHVISFNSDLGRKLVHYRTREVQIDKKKYNIRRQRTFDIDRANLYSYTEQSSDDLIFREGITDPFLINVLNTRKKQHQLVDIISTIQENQNTIVDRPLDKNIIVHGCAGSGKTMVLLHRLSYLKYQHPKKDFSKTVILTPNENLNLHINGLAENLQLGFIKRMSVGQYLLYVLNQYDDSFKFNGKISDEMNVNQAYVDCMYSKEFREFFWAAYEAQFNNILALYEEVKTIPPVFGRRTTFNDSIPLFSHAEDMLKELENINTRINKYKTDQHVIDRQIDELKRNRIRVEKEISGHQKRFEDNIHKEIREIQDIFERSIRDRQAQRKVSSDSIKDFNKQIFDIDKLLADENTLPEEKRRHKKNRTSLKSRITKTNNRIFELNREINELNGLRQKDISSMDPKELVEFLKSFQMNYRDFIGTQRRISTAIRNHEARLKEYEDSKETDKKILDLRTKRDGYDFFISYEPHINELCERLKDLSPKKMFESVYDDARQRASSYIQEKTGKDYSSGFSGTHRYDLFLQLHFAIRLFGESKGDEDLIFIDEGQDVIPETYALIIQANRRKPILNIFGDVNQVIKYNRGIHDWSQLKPVIPDHEMYFLNENYRNTNQIIEYCNKTFNMDVKMTGVEGKPVKIIEKYELADAFKELRIGGERIALLLPRKAKKKEYLNNQMFPEYITEVMGDEIEGGRITIAYVDEVKGVEFDKVFVVKNGMTKNEAYIACTRALSELTIVNDPRYDVKTAKAGNNSAAKGSVKKTIESKNVKCGKVTHRKKVSNG